MRTLAVVPVKHPHEAKLRLVGTLTPQERATLVRGMLAHVLETLLSSERVEKVAVISPDSGDLSLPDAVIRIEQRREGLNNILEQGREWAIEEEADALLILFADLPLITPAQISEMVHMGREPGTIVLAPDRSGEGTNALLSHPPSLARFRFGPHSYSRHMAAPARTLTYHSPGTALDIDTSEDLALLLVEPE